VFNGSFWTDPNPQMSIEREFAKNLRRLRKKAELTQERLAELAGLEYKYIQMLEGKTPPSATLRTLAKISKAFGIEVYEMLRFRSKKALNPKN